MLASFHLDKNLQTIVSSHHNLTYVVFTLVRWSNEQGVLDKLVSGALSQNPSNQDLSKFVYLTKSESHEIKETISPAPAPSDTAFLDVARAITVEFSNSILEKTRPVIREGIRYEIADLLTPTVHYCVLVGEAGSGKSTVLATESLHMMELGWTVWPLVVNKQDFSLAGLSDEVNERLPTDHPPLEWQEIVKSWGREAVEGSKGLVIVLDQVDVAPNDFARQLEVLNEVIERHNLSNVKVLVACRTGVWNRGLKDLSFFKGILEPLSDRSPHLLVIPVGDFTDTELDEFLQGIDADNLLPRADEPGQLDYHVESIRSLLKRPETSREFIELLSHGKPYLAENLTWSKLLELRLQHDLEPFGQFSVMLLYVLTELAEFCWQQKSVEFRVDLGLVKERIPDLFVEVPGTARTVFSHLEDLGVLVESESNNGNRIVSFRTVDTGSYLLSFTLEKEVRNKTSDDIWNLISSWLDEAWNYSPLLDAILAWMDRLSEEQHDPLLRWIVEAYIEKGRNISAFRLVDPRVIETIFALIETSDEDQFYAYREAALFLRPSREAIEITRRFLTSPNSSSRRLASELVGIHQDTASIPTLLALLEDEDEEVRSTTFQSFGRFGSAPLQFLLDALVVGSTSEFIRSRFLTALRNVGVRTEAVTNALTENLRSGLRGDSDYFRSGLLAAAHLRDKQQIPYAIAGLRHKDPDVILAAAKLLTETPHLAAFDFLLETLVSQREQGGRLLQTHWCQKQLLTALAATDRITANPIVMDYLTRAVDGKSELHFTEVLGVADRFTLVSAYPNLLQALVVRMTERRDGGFIFRASERLGSVWQQEPLDALQNASRRLLEEGSDIAKIFVDEILPNIKEHDEFPMGDRLNRVRDLHTIVKSQATNLVPETCRLLNETSELSTAELCELFWLAADVRAESALTEKLRQPMAKQRGGWFAKNAIVRALSMCSSEIGTKTVLSYLRSEPEISLYFSDEAVVPLLRRGAIEPMDLIDIVRDNTASVGGRIASIVTLADTDARAHKQVFLDHSGDDEDQLVQLYAVQALGSTGDSGVIPKLRKLLTESERPGIKSRAAQALSTLAARESIGDIESAFKNNGNDTAYVNALAGFHAPSSLPLLLERMRSVSPDGRRAYYAALGSFAFLSAGREALQVELESSLSRLPDYFDDQSVIFKASIQHEPNLLLETCQREGAWGRLSDNGRNEIARWMHYLWTETSADKDLLFATAKRLVCDRNVRVREMALLNLSLVKTGLGQELFDALINDPKADERVRACAVQSLGYFDGPYSQVEAFPYDGELLVRRAADAALELKQRRGELQFHESQLNSKDGLARLSSYLCLKEHGDLGSVHRLKQTIPKQSIQAAYAGHLARTISERLKRDNRKIQETEQKLFESRGAIWFD